MGYHLLSLLEHPPEGFTCCPVIVQKDVRRRPFALLAPDRETAETALSPFGPSLVGIIVTYGDRYRWQQLTPLRFHLMVPFESRNQLAEMLQPHLELLGSLHQSELRNAGLMLNLSRAGEDNQRQLLEFCTIKEILLKELSERKRVEGELRDTRNHLAATLDALPDLLFEVGADSCIYDYHSPCTELLAAPPEVFINKNMTTVLPPDASAVCLAAIQEAQAKFTSVGKQYELALPHGRFWFELSVSTKSVGVGDAPRFIILARDITKRKHAEQELQRKNADMEQFIYTVSHDLRSPLVTVKAFLGYLEVDMSSNDRERVVQDLQYIHGAADKMKLLLDELLELSRIDRVEAPPVTVSLNEIVQEVLDLLAGVVNDEWLEVVLPESNPLLFGDRPRFCQIWQNLIENAIKYSLGNVPQRVEIGVREQNGEPVFFVKDNGIGIDPQYNDRIFSMFEKLDPGSSGAGIGLAMVRRIIDKFGGSIWVESGGKDMGTCFHFTLPGAVRSCEPLVQV